MDEELKHHIAATIRAARKAKGLTQEDVAAKIDRTPESLSNLERGQATPSIDTLVALCEALEIDPEKILMRRKRRMHKSANEHRLEQEIIQMVSDLDEPLLQLAKTQIKAIRSYQQIK